MAVDLWSNMENSNLGMSPRISFSYDLCQTDLGTIERNRSDTMLLESNDFDFCTSKSFEMDEIPSSSADELFSEGKILPIEIKKQNSLPPKPPSHRTDHLKKESLKEMIEKSQKTEEKSSPSVSGSKSFWRFKRSNSCGNGYTRSLICSLPLLLRSNSTGSTPNPSKKDNHSHSSKHSSSSSSVPAKVSNGYTKSPLSTSSSSNGYPYSTQHNSKKNYGSYNNGIRVSPVLNVPPPYISKGTVNLFGLGSLFGGKDKNKKKRSEFVY